MRKFFPLFFFLLLAACSGEETTEEAPHGANVARLPLQTLAGDQTTLTEAVSSENGLILNVWATWCPPCLKELPSLLALQKQGPYQVVTIATDREAATVEKFLAKENLSDLTTYHDPGGRTTRALLNARQLPFTAIIDRTFTIRAVELGERDWAHEKMRHKIDMYLE